MRNQKYSLIVSSGSHKKNLLRRPLSLYPLHWLQTSFLEHFVENIELKNKQMQNQKYSQSYDQDLIKKTAPPSTTIPLSTTLATN